jgi:hypothetical protein
MSHPQLICMPIPLPVKAPDDVSDVTCPNIYQERVTVMTDPPAAIAGAREAVVSTLISIRAPVVPIMSTAPIAQVFAIFAARIAVVSPLIANISARAISLRIAIVATLVANVLTITVEFITAPMSLCRDWNQRRCKEGEH